MIMNDEDKLIEQSALQALKIAQNTTLDRTQRNAADSGFVAKTIGDGDMDSSWRDRHFSGGGNSVPDIQAREVEANEDAKKSRRIIEKSGGLSIEDLMMPSLSGVDKDHEAQANARKLMQLQHNTQRLVDNGARQIINDSYMGNMNEASMLFDQEIYSPTPQDSGWSVVKKTATLASGKSVPVFMVEDALTGMTTGKRYRLSEVADKVSKVLNATNNPNDTRIKILNDAYDRHVQLMQEKAQAKKAGNAQKVSIIEAQLQEVNTRLGLG